MIIIILEMINFARVIVVSAVLVFVGTEAKWNACRASEYGIGIKAFA